MNILTANQIESIATADNRHFLIDTDGNQWPITRASYFKLMADMMTIDEALEPINAELAEDMADFHAAVDSGLQMF